MKSHTNNVTVDKEFIMQLTKCLLLAREVHVASSPPFLSSIFLFLPLSASIFSPSQLVRFNTRLRECLSLLLWRSERWGGERGEGSKGKEKRGRRVKTTAVLLAVVNSLLFRSSMTDVVVPTAQTIEHDEQVISESSPRLYMRVIIIGLSFFSCFASCWSLKSSPRFFGISNPRTGWICGSAVAIQRKLWPDQTCTSKDRLNLSTFRMFVLFANAVYTKISAFRRINNSQCISDWRRTERHSSWDRTIMDMIWRKFPEGENDCSQESIPNTLTWVPWCNCSRKIGALKRYFISL